MLRTRKRMTMTEMSVRAQIERTRLGRIESGHTRITTEAVRAIGNVLELSADDIEELATLVAEIEHTDDFDVLEGPAFRQDEMLAHERSATNLSVSTSSNIPALLQTEAYARRSMTVVARAVDSVLSESYDEARNLHVRMRRQANLYDQSKTFRFVIDEVAFSRQFIDDQQEVKRQIDKLISVAKLPNVTLVVLPINHAVIVDPGYNYGIFDYAVALDTPAGALLTRVPGVVRSYQKHFERSVESAMTPEETVKWLLGLHEEIDRW